MLTQPRKNPEDLKIKFVNKSLKNQGHSLHTSGKLKFQVVQSNVTFISAAGGKIVSLQNKFNKK